MRLLLDTHALFWILRADAQLSTRAAAAIDDADEVLVSAVSAYELCLKHHAGKFPEAEWLAKAFEVEIARAHCIALPISVAHATVAATLDLRHRDPFDRLLIAQALFEQGPIVSNETLFDGFGVERIW